MSKYIYDPMVVLLLIILMFLVLRFQCEPPVLAFF
jgi:hypothetical protein